MSIHTARSTTTTTALVAAVIATLFTGGPAAAEPVPAEGTSAAAACPDIDVLVRSLRAAGFTSQAVKNYVELTRRDCNA